MANGQRYPASVDPAERARRDANVQRVLESLHVVFTRCSVCWVLAVPRLDGDRMACAWCGHHPDQDDKPGGWTDF